MKRWIHSKQEIVKFPEKIKLKLYPFTHTWIEYKKDYEHDGGGCYYHTDEDDDPVTSHFVSLYPDGTLTYTWNGVENPLDVEWEEA